ncbi:unnamed protein product, partial [marine sediment metagenome]
MKQGILETSPTLIYSIGKRIAIEDRVFHYCFGTDEGGLDAAGAAVAVAGNPSSQIGCFYNSNVHYHGDSANQALIPAGNIEFDWAYLTTAAGGHVA